MMRWLALLILLSVGMLFTATAATPDDSQATADPINMTGTALVQGATLTAAFGPSATPSGGTATPLAGLCNSLSFRSLDDVNAEMREALADSDLTLIETAVTALEDTEDCITFALRETEAVITVATLRINDEAALGTVIASILDAAATTRLPTLPGAVLEVRFVQGNQQRLIRVGVNAALALINADDAPMDADLLMALTWAE